MSVLRSAHNVLARGGMPRANPPRALISRADATQENTLPDTPSLVNRRGALV